MFNLVFAFLLLVSTPRAFAEPGRYAAVRALAAALPEKNPRAGSTVADAAASDAVEPLISCRWSSSEMDASDRLVRLFEIYLKADGSGKDDLLAAARRLPEYAGMDNDPDQRASYRQLELSVRLVPDIARARAITHGCRALLRSLFQAGESRETLLREVENRRGALDAAPAPL